MAEQNSHVLYINFSPLTKYAIIAPITKETINISKSLNAILYFLPIKQIIVSLKTTEV